MKDFQALELLGISRDVLRKREVLHAREPLNPGKP